MTMQTGQLNESRRKFNRTLSGLGLCSLFNPLVLFADSLDHALADHVQFRRLVAANRILANENVVDAFGHASVRNPENPNQYVMSRARSPEFVEYSDLMVFDLEGTPVNKDDRRPYGERMIHGAIYEARPDVNAVIHHHSYAVLPFSITDTPLRPVVHAASVIGKEIPVWDIQHKFGDTDMLARDMDKGRDLAQTLGMNTCLLMRGHGAVVASENVQNAVNTAIYLQVNADILIKARSLGEVTALTDAEVELTNTTQSSPLAMERLWEYLCRRAGIEPI